MRILVISNMYPSEAHPVFGAFVQRQVEALRASGVDVDIVANYQKAAGVIVNLPKYARLTWRALRAARRGAYDVIHAHFIYPTSIIGRWSSRVAHTPLVLTAHGNDVDNAATSRLAGPVGKALSSATAVVAVSNYLAGRLAEQFPISLEEIDVIDCGVDTDAFQPIQKADARLVADVPADATVVLFAGHLAESKGIGTLLAAHRRLVAEGRSVLLLVAGDGPMAPDVAAASRDPGVKGLVRAVGEVRHEEMAHWFASADVVCVPSHREGFGLVALEAMACGSPVVASDVGGLPEIIVDGVNGRLVPPADPDRLAAALGQTLSEDDRDDVASEARRTALEHSISAQTGKLIRLYRSLAAP